MVRRQSAPRLEFEAAAIYEYPEHLRPFLSEAPALPGVYIFHSESDTLPLYIGKSVNIRSRVLSHLRTPDEAAMLRQARRIKLDLHRWGNGRVAAGGATDKRTTAAV